MAVVPEDDVRKGDFFFDGELGGEHGLDQFVIPAIAGFESGDLGGTGCGDGDRLIVAEIETVFEKERDIGKEAPRPLYKRFFFEGKTFLTDTWMEDAFEELAFFGISEDIEPEFLADDFAGFRIDDGAAEMSAQGGDDFRGFEQGFHGGIAIEGDDVWNELLEKADSRGFSRSDTACECEGEHGGEKVRGYLLLVIRKERR